MELRPASQEHRGGQTAFHIVLTHSKFSQNAPVMYNEPRIHFVLFRTLLQAIYYYQKQKHNYMTDDKATSGI